MIDFPSLRQYLVLIAATAAWGLSHAVHASPALERLDEFFSNEQTYFAEFYQVVLDEGLHVIEESAGLMWFARPNRFRWEYREPFVQTIVSDGKAIWIYDSELQQTTVNNFEEVVDRSAAQILAGLSDLEEHNILEDLGIQGKLAWVLITPKEEGASQFLSMRMGFDENSLKIVEFIDLLDNTTRLQLIDVILNSKFDDNTFQFKVPKGVDLIDAREQ